MDKVTSDEPLYDEISDLDEYQSGKKVRVLSFSHAIFVSFASTACGLATWYTIDSGKESLGIEWWQHLMISILTTVLLGTSAIVSHHARCTVSLMLPALFSGVGRSLIRALIITLVVSGPLQNIIDNSLVLARSMECSTDLMIKQANETAQTTTSILQQQMESVTSTTRALNKQSKMVEEFANLEMVKILREEDKSGHLSPKKMMDTGAKQCHRNADGPSNKCGYGFRSDPDKCDAIKVSSDGCDDHENSENNNRINDNYTESIAESVAGFGEQYEEPNVTLTANNSVQVNTTSLIAGFTRTADNVKKVGVLVSTAMNWISILILFRLVINSVGHQVKFLTRDSYLNKVVTSNLLDLDAKLPAKHKTLPLPGYMQRIVRDGQQKCLSGDELQMIMIAVIKHCLLSTMFLFVVIMDIQIYNVLEDISDTGYTIYEVYIKIAVLLESDGGKWAKPIMDAIPQVNEYQHLSFIQDNNKCLPDARPPDESRTKCIVILILIIILIAFLEIYSQRTVRRICAWYYPERERKRVQWLFRFLKQRRIDCFNTMLEDRRSCLPQRTFLSKVANKFVKTKCVICASSDQHYVCFFCLGHGYDIVLCKVCWEDAGTKCPYCKTTQQLSSSSYKDLSLSCSSSSDDDAESHNVCQIDSTDHVTYKSNRGNGMSYNKIDESWADSSIDDDELNNNLRLSNHFL